MEGEANHLLLSLEEDKGNVTESHPYLPRHLQGGLSWEETQEVHIVVSPQSSPHFISHFRLQYMDYYVNLFWHLVKPFIGSRLY